MLAGTQLLPAGRRIAILGDLHLARPGARWASQLESAELLEAVEQLAASHERVVLNGDIYDLERGPLPSQRWEARTLRALHAPLEAQLRVLAPWWTVGNHDQVLGAPAALEQTTPWGRLRIEHGHRFDPPIKRFRPFTTLVTWASGRALATPGLDPAYRAMRSLEHHLSGSRSLQALDPVSQAALHWLEHEHSLQMLVIGHTHRPLLQRTAAGQLLVNPGDSLQRVRAASLDLEEGVVELQVFDGGQFLTVDRRKIAPDG